MTGKFGFILTRVQKRTPEQSRLAFIRSGILTPDGKLAEQYKSKPKEKAKKKVKA